MGSVLAKNQNVHVSHVNSELKIENESLRKELEELRKLEIGALNQTVNTTVNQIVEQMQELERKSKQATSEKCELAKENEVLKLVSLKAAEENRMLKQQLCELKLMLGYREGGLIGENSTKSSYNQLKSQLEEYKAKCEKTDAEIRELTEKKETLKNIISNSTAALLDTKAKLREATVRIDTVRSELDTLKSHVQENFISKDEHQQLMREQNEQIRNLQSEIQSFRDEFLSNITMNNNGEQNVF